MNATTFLLPVLDRWLFHAPLHRVSALLNDGAAAALRRGEIEHPGLRDLRDALSVDRLPEPRPLEGKICPSFLGILPTRGCNIGCVYCNFGGPTQKLEHMRPQVAVAAVDWMAERLEAAGRQLFRIHFFGGEPFVAPEIVDTVVQRARYQAARRGLETFIDASTNGVFNESLCRFIGHHFDGVVLSFDGPPRFHDRNRPGQGGQSTFDTVSRTALRLSEMPVELCIRVCVTQDSVSELPEIARWLIETYRPQIVNFESLTPGELANQAGLVVPDPYEFAVGTWRAYGVAESLGARAVYSAAEGRDPRLSFCPVGTDALTVTPEGRASSCYLLPEDWRARGLDLDLGHVHEDGRVDLDCDAVERSRRVPADKPRCERCACQWSCAGGCHVNQTYPGATRAYTDFCVQTRVSSVLLLLGELGQERLAARLAEDSAALERLALQREDRIDLPELAKSVSHEPARLSDSSNRRSLVADGWTMLG